MTLIWKHDLATMRDDFFVEGEDEDDEKPLDEGAPKGFRRITDSEKSADILI